MLKVCLAFDGDDGVDKIRRVSQVIDIAFDIKVSGIYKALIMFFTLIDKKLILKLYTLLEEGDYNSYEVDYQMCLRILILYEFNRLYQ